MTEKTDMVAYALSDNALLEQIGTYIKEVRLQQQKTQQSVAADAGIARSTLVQMENGRGGSLVSFIQVLRILGQLHMFRQFQVQRQVSPLLLARQEQARRKRAFPGKDSKGKPFKSDW